MTLLAPVIIKTKVEQLILMLDSSNLAKSRHNMDINERFVKLSGRLRFPKDVPLSEEVTVTIDSHSFIANCVKHETFDKQDGTVDVVYVLKSTLE